MLTALAILAGAVFLWQGENSSAREVAVTKGPMTVNERVFDPRNKPDPPPPIKPGLDADTQFDYTCHVNFDFSFDTSQDATIPDGRTRRQIHVKNVRADVTLPVTIWLPSNADKDLKEHERGHLKIVARVYEIAEPAAAMFAQRLVGMSFEGYGVDADSAQQDAINAGVKEFCRTYHSETRDVAQRIGDIYDEITNHGRNNVPADDAIQQAYARYKKEAPTKLVNRFGSTSVSATAGATTYETDLARDLHPDRTRIFRDIPYVPGSLLKTQTLDLYIPKDAKQPTPLIIFLHGGGWRGGDKTNHLSPGLLKAGYALASVNYRLTTEAIFPAQIHDVKAAVRWLRAHAKEYNYDPDRIGVWGYSAGGHLAQLVGTSSRVLALEGNGGNLDQSSKVQAVISWAGISDLTTIGGQAGKDNQLQLHKPVNLVSMFLGAHPNENKSLAWAASPIAYLSPDTPPMLIVHGEKDDVVPIEQSEQLYKAMKKAGLDATIVKLKGTTHDLRTPDALAGIIPFFDRHLKQRKPALTK
jgi:acetyl esterase/lipase